MQFNKAENFIYRVIVKSEPSEIKPAERSPEPISETDESTVKEIKIENIDVSDTEEEEKCPDAAETDPISVTPSYRISTENSVVTRTPLLSGNSNPSPISLDASTSAVDNKYCHVCDIKFKYLSSYLAHKKSYCRNNIQNNLDIGTVPSNQATSVIATTRSSPNQTSVVT